MATTNPAPAPTDASPELQLIAALTQFQALAYAAPKDSQNPYHKNTYASLASVLAAIQPATQFGLSHTVVFHPGETEARIVVTLHHVSGASIASELPLTMQADWQMVGSAMTYARRYLLMALYGLAPEDDDATAATTSPVTRQQSRAPRPPAQGQRQGNRTAAARPVQHQGQGQQGQAQQGAPQRGPDPADPLAVARHAIACSNLTAEGVHTLILQATDGHGGQLEDLPPAFLKALPGVVRTPQSVERLNGGLDTRTGLPVAQVEHPEHPEQAYSPDPDDLPLTWASADQPQPVPA